MNDMAIAGMVVMCSVCVTLGTLGIIALCFRTSFFGKGSKDGIEVSTNPGGDE